MTPHDSPSFAAACRAREALFARLEAACGAQVGRLIDAVEATFARGGRLLLAGNGGSAAECQHAAAEFVVRFHDTRRALPALALGADAAVLTALGNDLGFEHLFARQVEALGRRGDLLLVLSTSGRSPNLLRAAEVARSAGLVVFGLLGREAGPLGGRCDDAVTVPAEEVWLIQEAHLAMIHHLCAAVDRRLAAA